MSGQPKMDRREFLRNAGRGTLAAGLLGGIALLVLQPSSASGDCVKRIGCAECGSFTGCDLPRARTARNDPTRTARQWWPRRMTISPGVIC